MKFQDTYETDRTGDQAAFMAQVCLAHLRRYLSGEHFSVDGTLLEAWASHKSFRPKDGDDSGGPPPPGRNPEVNYHGERQSNETHQSTTDPEAGPQRHRDGRETQLRRPPAHGTAERTDRRHGTQCGDRRSGTRHGADLAAAIATASAPAHRAGENDYATRDFIAGCRALGVTPHVPQNTTNRRSAIDARTTPHPGHVVSLRIRKRIEEPFGWMKAVAGGRKLRYVGLQRNRAWFLMTGAVYNLIRITALDAQAA